MNPTAARPLGTLLALAAMILTAGCNAGSTDHATGQATGQQRRFVFLTNGDDPYWDTCRAGMDKAAEDLKIKDAGFLQVMDKGSEFKEDKQIAKLEQLATQTDVAAVAISPVDPKNGSLAKALETLRDHGVRVICVDSDMDRNKYRDSRFAYLGTDNFVGGQELGKAAKALLPQGGKYATFVGVKTMANAVDRIGGFASGAGDKFVSVDSLADGADEDLAQENVKSVLNNHPDVNMLVGIWAYNAHAIVRVVDERAIRDKTKVVVFDAAELALSDLAKGKIDVMVVQNPYQMGQLSVKLMKALVEDDRPAIKEIFSDYDVKTGKFSTPDGDIFHTELRVVVPDNETTIRPELFRPETKFFHYHDFKKWLDERHRVNS